MDMYLFWLISIMSNNITSNPIEKLLVSINFNVQKVTQIVSIFIKVNFSNENIHDKTP